MVDFVAAVRVPAGLVVTGLLLVACSQDEPAPAAAQPDPVVVYAAYEDKTYLPTLFNQFTQETGVVVIVRNGEMPGIVDDVLGKHTEPPADILITPSATGVWRVAEEGELRPNYSAVVASNVPVALKDSENYWYALSYRQAVIVFDPQQISAGDLTGYADLAAERFRRKLCLSASQAGMNRAVISILMHSLGRRDAELTVRGWVANLAQPPIATEAGLVQAIRDGKCAVGIVSGDAELKAGLQVFVPDDAYIDIEAAGVTRHARNPEAAARLIDWMLDPEIQNRHALHTAALPVLAATAIGDNIAVVAAGDEEAAKLAERARYR